MEKSISQGQRIEALTFMVEKPEFIDQFHSEGLELLKDMSKTLDLTHKPALMSLIDRQTIFLNMQAHAVCNAGQNTKTPDNDLGLHLGKRFF